MTEGCDEHKIEHLYLQDSKYTMFWREQLSRLYSQVFQCMVIPEEWVIRSFIVDGLYPTQLESLISELKKTGELSVLGGKPAA